MRGSISTGLCALSLLLLAGGCGSTPPATTGTGARKTVEAFYEALIRDDWDGAYAVLHPSSRAQWRKDVFVHAAQNYSHALGFVAKAVLIRSCEEHGTEALAHVFLIGQAEGKEKRFRDGVTLEQTGDGWGVVLPSGFGAMK
jgi:hypothetical protein